MQYASPFMYNSQTVSSLITHVQHSYCRSGNLFPFHLESTQQEANDNFTYGNMALSNRAAALKNAHSSNLCELYDNRLCQGLGFLFKHIDGHDVAGNGDGVISSSK